MVESMHALAPLPKRRPAARKPRLPHPHLPARPAERVTDPTPGTEASPIHAAAPSPQAESWTPAALPMARPAGSRRRQAPPTPGERTLRNAIRFGFFVNAAALLIPRFFPAGTAWNYGGGDFLLAAAVLLSGQALLLLGRSARPDRS